MALPRGRKQPKNGRAVYSQSARAVKYRQEMGVGEFAEDAAADNLQPPITVETPQESVSSSGELSTESIGVVTTVTVPEEPLAAHVEDAPNYHCENCKGGVTLGDTECATCEESLNWSGLT
jgi:hypothetical protein